MSESFKAGDIVRLKSGSPAMTVGSVSSTEALCIWFDNDKKPTTMHFPFAALRLEKSQSD